MSSQPIAIPHPLRRCVAEIAAALDAVAEVDPRYLPGSERAELLVELSRQGERLSGLRLRVLAGADDVAAETGARNVAAWLAHETRADYPGVARDRRLGKALDSYVATAAALGAGQITTEQAAVIVTALDDLPHRIEPTVKGRAEGQLIAYAADFAPTRLRVLGRRILDVVAPEVAEDDERHRVERQERHARLNTRITTRHLGDGMSRAVVELPTATMELWLTQLHAYASPRRDHLDDPSAGEAADRRDPETGARVSYSRLLGQAFCTMLEHVPTDRLPQHGGTAVAMNITLTLDQLRTGLGVAQLSTGEVITAGEARRLACTSRLIPLVLGGKSEILDQGRARRFFTPAQRRALEHRDRRCRAVGCEIPAAWTEAHHATDPWAAGGRTDLADGILLCPHHHHRAHDQFYDQRRLPNGDLRFHRRR